MGNTPLHETPNTANELAVNLWLGTNRIERAARHQRFLVRAGGFADIDVESADAVSEGGANPIETLIVRQSYGSDAVVR